MGLVVIPMAYPTSQPPFPLQETEVLSLKPTGLYTYPNPLSQTPQGAMSLAENIIMSRPNIIEQRRGMDTYGADFSKTFASGSKLYNYQNTIISFIQNAFYYDQNGDGSAWTAIGNGTPYSPPPNAVVPRSVQAQKNIYFSTSTGIQKLDII